MAAFVFHRIASVVALTSGLLTFSAMAALLAPKEGEEAGPKVWPVDPAKHQIVIKRDVLEPSQAAMISAAEAVPAPKEELQKAAKLEADQPAIPEGGQVWWYQEKLNLRIPYSITSDAISYYSEIVTSDSKKSFKSYAQPSSHLNYQASVKFHKEITLDDKPFKDVNVVTLKLSFSADFTLEATSGLSFEKTRTVVLDSANKVLHVSGDGPTETRILML